MCMYISVYICINMRIYMAVSRLFRCLEWAFSAGAPPETGSSTKVLKLH